MHKQLAIWTLWLSAWGAIPGWGQTPGAELANEVASTTTPVGPGPSEALRSPRTTFESFFERVEAGTLNGAAECLDLSHLTTAVAESRGPSLASKLKQVLDRMGRVPLARVPGGPDTPSPWTLAEMDKFASLEDAREIELVRDQQPRWRFSRRTVDAIDALYEVWKDRPVAEGIVSSGGSRTFDLWLKDQFSSPWQTTHFMLPNYQWLALAAVLLLGMVADFLTRRVLQRSSSAWFKYVVREEEAAIETGLWRPVGLLVQASVWYGGTKAIGLPPVVLTVLLVGLKLFAVIAGLWTAFLLINFVSRFLYRRASHTATRFDDILVPLISKSLKIVAVCIAVLTGAQAFDLPIAGLIGGLGIGGLAVGFAAQDMLKNFFGSIMIFSDRPFELGDRIQVDGFDGPVEAVGFRSTRLRTFEGALVTIPNGELANKTICNVSKRPYLRRKFTIGVTYDTPREKLEEAIAIVRELLDDHEGMDPAFPPRVYFDDLAADSLNISVIYWYHAAAAGQPLDYWAFCDFGQRLNLALFRRFADAGIEFAFPTQTVFVAGDPERPLGLAGLTPTMPRPG